MIKSEVELIKEHIKSNYCNHWTQLHGLGRIIFEEMIYGGVLLLRIKNKYFWLTHEDNNIGIRYIKTNNIYSTYTSHHFDKKFKLDWFINILAKNDRVVEYLYGKI